MVIKRRLVTLFIGAMIIVSLVLAGLLQPPGADISSGTVAIVPVRDNRRRQCGRTVRGLLAGSGTVVKQLQTAAQDDIKAVVLRINSPGGTAAPQEMAAGIAYLQKRVGGGGFPERCGGFRGYWWPPPATGLCNPPPSPAASAC